MGSGLSQPLVPVSVAPVPRYAMRGPQALQPSFAMAAGRGMVAARGAAGGERTTTPMCATISVQISCEARGTHMIGQLTRCGRTAATQRLSIAPRSACA